MSQDPTIHYVVFHYPGENWVEGVEFREQPNVMEHVVHYKKWLDEGKLLIGGPFLPPHTGGMMVATSDVSQEDLEAYAAADPTVLSGLLTFEVKAWYVPMSSLSKLASRFI